MPLNSSTLPAEVSSRYSPEAKVTAGKFVVPVRSESVRPSRVKILSEALYTSMYSTSGSPCVGEGFAIISVITSSPAVGVAPRKKVESVLIMVLPAQSFTVAVVKVNSIPFSKALVRLISTLVPNSSSISISETVTPPEMVKSSAAILPTSMDSLKVTLNCWSEITSSEVSSGAVVSGVLSKTEFCTPGVPPEVLLVAVQLASSKQAASGLIISRLKPPAALVSSP